MKSVLEHMIGKYLLLLQERGCCTQRRSLEHMCSAMERLFGMYLPSAELEQLLGNCWGKLARNSEQVKPAPIRRAASQHLILGHPYSYKISKRKPEPCCTEVGYTHGSPQRRPMGLAFRVTPNCQIFEQELYRKASKQAPPGFAVIPAHFHGRCSMTAIVNNLQENVSWLEKNLSQAHLS